MIVEAFKNLKGKRLLLLGSSVWKDLIKAFADEYGVVLIFAGSMPSCVEEIADETYRIDSTNRELMIPFIKKHNIDGVYMGGSEWIISHACDYINELGLPCYCEKEQWDVLQNKSNFKDLCAKFDLPVVPKFQIDPDNIEGSIEKKEFPVITKPVDSSGSRGFTICHNSDELKRGYEFASSCSPTGSVICEKFVKNAAVVAFYSILGDEIVFCGIEDKIPVKYDEHGTYVAGFFHFPSALEYEFRCRFESGIHKMLKYLNLHGGSIWMEIFHDGDTYYFNEAGYRHGGSFSFYPLNYLYGINQFYYDLYYALTGEGKLLGFPSLISGSVKRCENYCVYPIHCNAGKIAVETGVEEIIEKYPKNIVVIPHKYNIGDVIADSGSFAQVYSLFHFVCDSVEECREIVDFIQKTYKVRDPDGNNIVRVMLRPEDICGVSTR